MINGYLYAWSHVCQAMEYAAPLTWLLFKEKVIICMHVLLNLVNLANLTYCIVNFIEIVGISFAFSIVFYQNVYTTLS